MTDPERGLGATGAEIDDDALTDDSSSPEDLAIHRFERETLEEDLKGNPLAGEPIRQRLRNFRPDASAAISALAGPTAWMRRLRAIELAGAEVSTRFSEAQAPPVTWATFTSSA